MTPIRGKPIGATSPQPRQDSPTSTKRSVKPLRKKHNSSNNGLPYHIL